MSDERGECSGGVVRHSVLGEMVSGEWDEWVGLGRRSYVELIGGAGGGSDLGVGEGDKDPGWAIAFSIEEAERWTALVGRRLPWSRDGEWAGIWLGRFVRSVEPRRLGEVMERDVQRFLEDAAGLDAPEWALRQADRAVRFALRDVLKLGWARKWPDFLGEFGQKVGRGGRGGSSSQGDGGGEGGKARSGGSLSFGGSGLDRATSMGALQGLQWEKIELTEEEENSGPIVEERTESTGGRLEGLDS